MRSKTGSRRFRKRSWPSVAATDLNGIERLPGEEGGRRGDASGHAPALSTYDELRAKASPSRPAQRFSEQSLFTFAVTSASLSIPRITALTRVSSGNRWLDSKSLATWSCQWTLAISHFLRRF